VAIGARAAIAAQAAYFAVEECVKAAFHGPALVSAAVDVTIGCGDGRLGHQRCGYDKMGKDYLCFHDSSSATMSVAVARQFAETAVD
jgi:hypothetical protein